jgi:hypothetical protein
MSDGPTKEEQARDKLLRAAVSYARAGGQSVTEEARARFLRAENVLSRAALVYAAAVKPRIGKR